MTSISTQSQMFFNTENSAFLSIPKLVNGNTISPSSSSPFLPVTKSQGHFAAATSLEKTFTTANCVPVKMVENYFTEVGESLFQPISAHVADNVPNWDSDRVHRRPLSLLRRADSCPRERNGQIHSRHAKDRYSYTPSTQQHQQQTQTQPHLQAAHSNQQNHIVQVKESVLGKQSISAEDTFPSSDCGFSSNLGGEIKKVEVLTSRELEAANCRSQQLERTMRWWSDCTTKWRDKWLKVRQQRNQLRDELKQCQLLINRLRNEQIDAEKVRQEKELYDSQVESVKSVDEASQTVLSLLPTRDGELEEEKPPSSQCSYELACHSNLNDTKQKSENKPEDEPIWIARVPSAVWKPKSHKLSIPSRTSHFKDNFNQTCLSTPTENKRRSAEVVPIFQHDEIMYRLTSSYEFENPSEYSTIKSEKAQREGKDKTYRMTTSGSRTFEDCEMTTCPRMFKSKKARLASKMEELHVEVHRLRCDNQEEKRQRKYLQEQNRILRQEVSRLQRLSISLTSTVESCGSVSEHCAKHFKSTSHQQTAQSVQSSQTKRHYITPSTSAPTSYQEPQRNVHHSHSDSLCEQNTQKWDRNFQPDKNSLWTKRDKQSLEDEMECMRKWVSYYHRENILLAQRLEQFKMILLRSAPTTPQCSERLCIDSGIQRKEVQTAGGEDPDSTGSDHFFFLHSSQLPNEDVDDSEVAMSRSLHSKVSLQNAVKQTTSQSFRTFRHAEDSNRL